MKNIYTTLLHILAYLLISFTLLVTINSCKKDEIAEPKYSAEEIVKQIVLPQEEKYESFEKLLKEGKDTATALLKIKKLFLEDPNVYSAEIGKQGIAVTYTSGINGGLFIDPLDYPEYSDNKKHTLSTSDIQNTSGDLKKAVFLNATYFERKQYADKIINNYIDILEEANFGPLDVYLNEDVTLDKLALLSDHELIHIYSHGMAFPTSENIQRVYLLTGESFNVDSYEYYFQDLEDQTISIITVSISSSKFWIDPTFISHYNRLDKNMLFYGGFCYSFLGGWPEELVEKKKIGGYFGFDWSVWTEKNASYNRSLMREILKPYYRYPKSVNDWLFNDAEKEYINPDQKKVSLKYSGDPAFSFFTEDFECSNTEYTSDEKYDIYIQPIVIVKGNQKDIPVTINFEKIHCDGHIGRINPDKGVTNNNGKYVSNIVGIFSMKNKQDKVIITVEVNGVKKVKVYFAGCCRNTGLFWPDNPVFHF
jgi:hypothetical protein